MTDTNELRELERRLERWLHATAPQPDAGYVSRVLATTAATPQRRSRFGASAFVPALAAAVVVGVAVVIGLQLGQLLVGPDAAPPIGEDPTRNAAPTVDISPSPVPSSSPPSSPSPEAFPSGQRCQNLLEGYAVSYPADWYANAFVDAPEGLDDIPACRYFGPAEFEVAPNAGLGPAVAIAFSVLEQETPRGGELIAAGEAEVDGQRAMWREWRLTQDSLIPAGTLVYEYFIARDGGGILHIATDSARVGDYETNKDVLDRMARTLDLFVEG